MWLLVGLIGGLFLGIMVMLVRLGLWLFLGWNHPISHKKYVFILLCAYIAAALIGQRHGIGNPWETESTQKSTFIGNVVPLDVDLAYRLETFTTILCVAYSIQIV